jgi:TRAP-type C4-dicarboxylate transport system permease small subunit
MKINWIKTTRIVMGASVILLLLYDCFAAYFGGHQGEATISRQFGVLANPQNYVYAGYIVFATGLLAGHLLAEVQLARQLKQK